MKTNKLCIVDLITTLEDRKYEAAGRMADAIISIILKQGHCVPQDLTAECFLPHEVAVCWHMSYSLACVELRYFVKEVHYA